MVVEMERRALSLNVVWEEEPSKFIFQVWGNKGTGGINDEIIGLEQLGA